MKPPLIGLTTDPAGRGYGYHTAVDYVHAVLRAGGAPVLLPPVGDAAIDSWLDALDGVVLIGGGDIDPELFDGGAHPQAGRRPPPGGPRPAGRPKPG
ncbi:hypothetical protein C3L29_034785 [Pseudomonas sp. MWU12-2534b]|nr:hypothetical protein C3L29_034785 [Pseudomonas sp. MWU12-2534b]